MSQESTQALERVATEVVASHAGEVDRTGNFPAQSIEALAQAGLLGLVSASEVGGGGQGPRAAAWVVERLARECGSTAMVMCMHYTGVAVLERYAPLEVRSAAAAGRHLSTLAFSEAGSRSHFWAPVGTAGRADGGVVLNARKSFVTSASKATAYVWSSRPLAAPGTSTLWLVPAGLPGLRVPVKFDGLGLRGNDSAPVIAEKVRVDASSMLGPDGAGLQIMLEVALPWFNVLSAAYGVGLMHAATERTVAHAAGVRFEPSDESLAALPTVRAYMARMRIKTDAARALLLDTLDALERARPDAVLRVLECKTAAGESATEVLDLAMRVCGGAAFRKELGVERMFRDARASTVMAPTTDALYDFIGRALCGMELLG
jgi:alkylation response protein AidB-like acyl-CoA dehydrogenase